MKVLALLALLLGAYVSNEFTAGTVGQVLLLHKVTDPAAGVWKACAHVYNLHDVALAIHLESSAGVKGPSTSSAEILFHACHLFTGVRRDTEIRVVNDKAFSSKKVKVELVVTEGFADGT